jgi:hypothetical protein
LVPARDADVGDHDAAEHGTSPLGTLSVMVLPLRVCRRH